jgi:hypothetical protein
MLYRLRATNVATGQDFEVLFNKFKFSKAYRLQFISKNGDTTTTTTSTTTTTITIDDDDDDDDGSDYDDSLLCICLTTYLIETVTGVEFDPACHYLQMRPAFYPMT